MIIDRIKAARGHNESVRFGLLQFGAHRAASSVVPHRTAPSFHTLSSLQTVNAQYPTHPPNLYPTMSHIAKAMQYGNRLPRLLRNHPRPTYTRLALARPTLSSRIQHLSTTSRQTAALASSLPTHPTEVLFAPSQEAIEKEELDVELLPPEQVKLEITDRAAEVSLSESHLHSIL